MMSVGAQQQYYNLPKDHKIFHINYYSLKTANKVSGCFIKIQRVALKIKHIFFGSEITFLGIYLEEMIKDIHKD